MNNPILLSGKSDKSLMVFNNTNFGSIRTVELNGKSISVVKMLPVLWGIKKLQKQLENIVKGCLK